MILCTLDEDLHLNRLTVDTNVMIRCSFTPAELGGGEAELAEGCKLDEEVVDDEVLVDDADEIELEVLLEAVVDEMELLVIVEDDTVEEEGGDVVVAVDVEATP